MVSCAFAATGSSEIANAAPIKRSFIFLVLLDTAPSLLARGDFAICGTRSILHFGATLFGNADHTHVNGGLIETG